MTNQFQENHKKILESQMYGPRTAQTEKFMKLKIVDTPKLCWADQVKFEFQGHLKGQKGLKRKMD